MCQGFDVIFEEHVRDQLKVNDTVGQLRDLSISIKNPQEKLEVGEELWYNYFKCSQEWKRNEVYMENG